MYVHMGQIYIGRNNAMYTVTAGSSELCCPIGSSLCSLSTYICMYYVPTCAYSDTLYRFYIQYKRKDGMI